jgi:hypothetical protein
MKWLLVLIHFHAPYVLKTFDGVAHACVDVPLIICEPGEIDYTDGGCSDQLGIIKEVDPEWAYNLRCVREDRFRFYKEFNGNYLESIR